MIMLLLGGSHAKLLFFNNGSWKVAESTNMLFSICRVIFSNPTLEVATLFLVFVKLDEFF